MERGGSHSHSMRTLSNSGVAWKHSFWPWFRTHHQLWSRGNLDAAFAQFFNTIISLMLIVTVCNVRLLRLGRGGEGEGRENERRPSYLAAVRVMVSLGTAWWL